MDAFFVMLRNVLLFVALAVPGFILVKKGWIKKEQSEVISGLITYIGFPFMVAAGTIGSITVTNETFLALLLSFLLYAAFTFLALFAARPLTAFEKEPKRSGMIKFCSVMANNGFLGMPLGIAVFGINSPVIPVMIAANIVNGIMLNTIGLYLVTGDKSRINLKNLLFNPVMIAFVVGILLNLCHVPEYVPEVTKFCEYLGNIVTPLSMTVIGMKLGSINFKDVFCGWKVYYVAFLKLVAFPLAAVCVLFALRVASQDIFTVAFCMGLTVSFSTPTATLSTAFADRYGGDVENAVAYTLGSTLLSVITLPLLFALASAIFV